MFPNYLWCELVAYETIAEANRTAALDRPPVFVVQASREAQQPAGSRLAGLYRILAGALAFSRPVPSAPAQEPHAE